MCDRGGIQVAHLLKRCAISDREELKYSADGSLDVHLQ